ncbi:MAG: branched-chain amino acid ABC transporter permease [Gammaproteobacteria bacterium]|nr:branched-chain amino acid ABC transporter permease [Gammaproteobacteria bacterium]
MFAQQLINGLMLGASYALVAIGYTLIFGVLRLLHFAHGEVFMFGAFIGLNIVLAWSGVNIYVAIIGAMIGTGLIGLLVALIAVRPVSSKYPLAPLISTIGATLVMQNVAIRIFGGENQAFPETMDPVIYHIAGLTISSVQIFTLVMSVVLMVVLWMFVNRSKMGRAMRAVAESHETAALLGVNVGRTVLFTFMVASFLAGAAGVLDGIRTSAVSPFMGLEVAVAALVCMLLGGLGNIVGAMVGGFILGMVEILSAAYLGTSLRDLFTFVILILILIYKPSGLFGTRVVGD